MDPTLQNDFFLAEKLHMLPSEFRDRISNAEYVQLAAYHRVSQTLQQLQAEHARG